MQETEAHGSCARACMFVRGLLHLVRVRADAQDPPGSNVNWRALQAFGSKTCLWSESLFACDLAARASARQGVFKLNGTWVTFGNSRQHASLNEIRPAVGPTIRNLGHSVFTLSGI